MMEERDGGHEDYITNRELCCILWYFVMEAGAAEIVSDAKSHGNVFHVLLLFAISFAPINGDIKYYAKKRSSRR